MQSIPVTLSMALNLLDGIRFVPKHRNYTVENELHALESTPAIVHPLTKHYGLQRPTAEDAPSKNSTTNQTAERSLLTEPLQENTPELLNQYDPLSATTADFSTAPQLASRSLSYDKKTLSNGSFLGQNNIATAGVLPQSNHSVLSRELNDSWATKRVNIIIKHTPPQRLPLVTGFLSHRDTTNNTAASRAALQSLRHAAGSVGRIQNRLAILQELDLNDESAADQNNSTVSVKSIGAFSSTILGGGSSSSSNGYLPGLTSGNNALSEEQIFVRVHQAKRQLKIAWDKDQRVIALRHVIQCAKLLGDSHSNPLFYPTKWIIVADVLDLFTTLLYDRLLDKSELPKRTTRVRARDVSEKAKEICRNWLYKITCIRELLPRLLIEIAILPCMKFLEDGDEDDDDGSNENEHISSKPSFYQQALVRLQKIIRGIGDPLVAIWCRAYLAKVACCSTTTSRRQNMPHLHVAVEDFIRSQSEINAAYERCRTPTQSGAVLQQNFKKADYVETYNSALEWILECMARLGKSSALDHLLTICGNNRLLLRAILQAFDSATVAKFTLIILDKIRFMPADEKIANGVISHAIDEAAEQKADSDAIIASRAQLIRSLGTALSTCPTIELDALPKRKVLNSAWQVISPLNNNLAEYTKCVEAWCEFATRMLGRKEIDIILLDLLQHINTSGENLPVVAKSMANGVGNGIKVSNSTTTAEKLKFSTPTNSVLYSDLVQDNLLRICQQILARPGGGGAAKSSTQQNSSYSMQLCDLLNSPHILKLFDILYNGQRRSQTARAVADSFYKGVCQQNSSSSDVAADSTLSNFFTNDPVLISTLQTAMRTLASESLDDALASDDERRNTSRILMTFICSVDYGRDLETQLHFYVQCRENFYRFDDVLVLLVELVLGAAMRARTLRTNKVTNSSSAAAENVVALRAAQTSRRTGAFVHSCCAYAFITIPSLVGGNNSATMQYKLYLHLTQVCLANQCIGQAEASLRAALQLLYSESGAILSEAGNNSNSTTAAAEIRTGSKSMLLNRLDSDKPSISNDDRAVAKLVAGVFSVLLVMPDRFVPLKNSNPGEQQIDTLFWYRSFMNACDVFCDSVKYFIKVDSLAYLCAAWQTHARYCLHIAGIDANDTLYQSSDAGGSAMTDYVQALQEALDSCLRSILAYVADCITSSSEGPPPAQLQNGLVVFEKLVNVLVAHGDLPKMQALVNYFDLMLKPLEKSSVPVEIKAVRQRVFALLEILRSRSQ